MLYLSDSRMRHVGYRLYRIRVIYIDYFDSFIQYSRVYLIVGSKMHDENEVLLLVGYRIIGGIACLRTK